MLSRFCVDFLFVAAETPATPPGQQAQGNPWDLFKGLLVKADGKLCFDCHDETAKKLQAAAQQAAGAKE
jgi:hypothetical protein